MTDKQLQDLREQLRQKMAQAGMMKPLPQAERAARLDRCATDKAFFLRTYCPHYFPYDFSAHHLRILERCDTLNQPYLIMAFRGFGKSSLASFGDPLYKICLQRRNFLLFVSITEDVAESCVTALKLEFEENPRLQQDFGALAGSRTWTTTECVTRTNRKLLARGIMQPFRGLKHGQHRPDDVTLDDFENDQSAESAEQTSKILARVWKAVRPALRRKKDGGFSMKFIGTPITPECATSQLYADNERSLLKDRIPLVDDDGNITWPDVYDRAEVDAIRRDSGVIAWHSEYLLSPLPSGARDFQDAWLQTIAERDVPMFDGRDVTYGAVDPSFTSSGDYKAVVTLTGRRSTMEMFVRHCFLKKCSPKDLCRAIYEQQEAYGCDFVIEDNSLKEFLWDAVENFEKDNGVHLRLHPITHGAGISKEARIRRLQSPMERLKFFFLKGHSEQDLLRDQLRVFPNGKHDDGPDALEEAYQQVMRRLRGGNLGAGLLAGARRETAGLNAHYTDFEGYL